MRLLECLRRASGDFFSHGYQCLTPITPLLFRFYMHAHSYIYIYIYIQNAYIYMFAFIQIPHKLFKEMGYDHGKALFGIPAYGGSIAQNVFYADSDLCDPTVDKSKGYPTREIDPETKKMAPWPSPYILMVDRGGGCTFVQKVCLLSNA
jgi:hypothetical protein